MTTDQVIVINSGSSSIKFATFDFDENLQKTMHGSIENIKTAPVLKISDEQGHVIRKEEFSAEHDYAFFYELLFTFFASTEKKLKAIGHRVVHGSHLYYQPTLITDKVISDLKTFIPFAPLHQPYNIQAIEIIKETHPDLPQVACFDTAFHRTHPRVADTFGLPRKFTESGVRRYGFHGLSYEYIASKLEPHGRVVVAHLGNGASMCAIKDRKSIDSTMGFTALDGLLMGTRCGSLDPGVILYLMQFKQMDHHAIETLLYQESGLLGVSGVSNNMQTLVKHNSAPAKEAIELFVYRIKRELGALVSVLNGLDTLVFTGGIGENSAPIRQAVCHNMEWLGIKLDAQANNLHSPVISEPSSAISVRVIPTNEEWVIAKQTYERLKMPN